MLGHVVQPLLEFLFSDLPFQGKFAVVHATQEQVNKSAADLQSCYLVVICPVFLSYWFSSQEEVKKGYFWTLTMIAILKLVSKES